MQKFLVFFVAVIGFSANAELENLSQSQLRQLFHQHWEQETSDLPLMCGDSKAPYSPSTPDLEKAFIQYEVSTPKDKDKTFRTMVKQLGTSKPCNLSREEALAIRTYSTGTFQYINGELRGGGAKTATIQSLVKFMVEGMSRLAPINGFVRRGATPSERVDALYQVGAIVKDPGFMSTSVKSGFQGTHKIVIRTFTKCTYIAPLSMFSNEEEALCFPGAPFKVLFREPDGFGGFNIVMEEVLQ